MKEEVKYGLGCIGAIVLLIALGVGFDIVQGYGNAAYTRTAGIAQQNATTEVFKHSTAFVQGKETEISRLRLDMESEKDPTTKSALRRRIIETAAPCMDEISNETREYVVALKGGN